MSRLKKNAAELLNNIDAAKSFSEDLGQIIKDTESALDSTTQAAMFLDSLENQHYLGTPDSLRKYLRNLADNFEDILDELENYKKNIENGKIKFEIDH